jgi:hypothetical protein
MPTANLLASTSNGEGASLIGIEDAGGFFTATDVEGALAELGDRGNAAVTFTATGAFAYRHANGLRPGVTVLDSGGNQIEVCVTHTDVNTVVLSFVGTITGGILVLS